jgi:hypothetical protein
MASRHPSNKRERLIDRPSLCSHRGFSDGTRISRRAAEAYDCTTRRASVYPAFGSRCRMPGVATPPLARSGNCAANAGFRN